MHVVYVMHMRTSLSCASCTRAWMHTDTHRNARVTTQCCSSGLFHLHGFGALLLLSLKQLTWQSHLSSPACPLLNMPRLIFMISCTLPAWLLAHSDVCIQLRRQLALPHHCIQRQGKGGRGYPSGEPQSAGWRPQAPTCSLQRACSPDPCPLHSSFVVRQLFRGRAVCR